MFNEYTSHKRQRTSSTRLSDDPDPDTLSSVETHESSKKEKGSPKKPHLSESDLSARCFRRGNHVYFYAGVSKDSVYRMHEHLLKINEEFEALRQKNPTVTITPSPIILHINSFGGGVFAAFAAIDFIQQSRIPVHTVIEGATASAGTLMSIVGKKRYIRPHASMLIHQLSGWFGGKMTEIDDDYRNVKQMHESIKQLYVEHTHISGADLDELLTHDVWWKADKCLAVGLVDAEWADGG
jgi:ATP-dependent protease ClpP protease subunit